MGKHYFRSLILTLILSMFTFWAQAQYCVPSFSTGCTSSDYIDDFIIKDSIGATLLSHLGTGCSSGAYGDYTGDVNLNIELDANADYDFEATHGTSSSYIRIWIDFDGNEDFEDAGELIYESTTAGSTTSPTIGSFTIPDLQGIITTRMRVRNTWSTGVADSCTQSGSWGEVHDYLVTIIGENEDCFSPSNLDVTVLSSSEVELTWDDSADVTEGYEWHLMAQGEHPDDDTPLQSGTLSAGDESVEIDSLTENVFYDFYIQGECDDDEFTVWRTIEFYIAGEGADCSNPFEVNSLPYVNSNDTADFLNLLSGEPGDDCGTADEYLSGNDVIYRYEADDDYLLTVSLDSISANYSAVFVYGSCADIGDSCATEGSVAEDSKNSHGFDMLVEEGETYYFVVSSAEPTESFDYTLNINGYGCNDIPAPTIVDASPYFMAGDFLSSLEDEVNFLRLSDGGVWYSDAGLTTEITDPDNELIVDGITYYITQKVSGCEGDALAITPVEFDCSVLSPIIDVPIVGLCVPGGYAELKAELSPAGNELFWYESKTDTIPVQKGGILDLGYVEESTSYWVTEARLGGEGYEDEYGKVAPTTTSSYGSTLNYGLQFDVDQEFTLHSVDVYPDASGDLEISLFDSTGQLIDSHTETVSSSMSDPVTIVLDFEVPEGTGLRLLQTSSPSIALIRDSSGNAFPYELGDNGDYGSITNGTYGTSSTNSTSYYYFYNWEVGVEEVLCESDRFEVQVIVSDDIPDAPEVERKYTFCGVGTYTLADIEVEGDQLVWYDRAGNVLEETTEVEDGKTYYVVDKSGGCVSDIAEVHISIRDLSELPTADEEQNFVEGETLADLDVTGVQLKWYADADKEEPLDKDTELEDSVTYYVAQTRSGYCESEALGITVTKVLGVANYNFENFEYFPNPVEYQLTLQNEKEIQSVEVYDMQGRTVLMQNNIHKTRANLDFENITTGNYLMKVFVEDSMKTIHIIKK